MKDFLQYYVIATIVIGYIAYNFIFYAFIIPRVKAKRKVELGEYFLPVYNPFSYLEEYKESIENRKQYKIYKFAWGTLIFIAANITISFLLFTVFVN